MKNKTCFVIVGPTSSGKTSFAIQLAKYFNTQIISADSRQCYRELTIGVAKPSPHDLEDVKHYFINTHSIHQDVNAKIFEEYGCRVIKNIFAGNDVAIMVGGTGLYVNAFCDGIDEMPLINKGIKKNIISNFKQYGIDWLQNEIKKEDPLYFEKGEIKNPQRLMRALEVKLATGKSIIEFQTRNKKENDFDIIKIGLEINKEQLSKNINERADTMIERGLIEEVKSLIPYRHLNALQTVGYKEIFDYIDDKISLNEATEKIKINTRQYAKRQLTWFKRDKEIKWIDVVKNDFFIDTCREMMSKN